MKHIRKPLLWLAMTAVFVCFCCSGIVNAEEIRTIDLTGLVTGTDAAHECVWENKFDDSYHWEQCFLCNKVRNKVGHSLTTTGTYTCHVAYDAQQQYCTSPACGYRKTLPKKSHTHEPITPVWNGYVSHYLYRCSECRYPYQTEQCQDVNGRRLGCGSGRYTGTCATCGHNYDGSHAIASGGFSAGIMYCEVCHEKFADIKNVHKSIVSVDTTRFSFEITPISGLTINLSNSIGSCATPVTGTNYSAYLSGGTYYVSFDATAKGEYSALHSVHWYPSYTYKGYTKGFHVATAIKQDNYAPVKQSITVAGNGTVNNFSRKATITCIVTEQYTGNDNIVSMRLLDTDKTPIKEWVTAARNGNTYTGVLDIVAEIREPSTIYVQTKDYSGNVSEFPVTVQYIDTKPPTLLTKGPFASEWSKTKNIDFMAADMGIGSVDIGFNSLSDMQHAVTAATDNYSRSYIFTGDVYGSVTGAIYCRDALGNVSTTRVEIGKLDNTAPTVNSVSKDISADLKSMKLSVAADDINRTLNASGSGVSEYSISQNPDTPGTWQTGNAFTVTDNGTYYVWAKDAVGNTSVEYAVVVSEIRTSVRINIAWNDKNNKYLTRPSSVKVNLYRNGAVLITQQVSGNMTADKWEYTFEDLEMKDASNNTYAYTVGYDGIASQSNPSDAYSAEGEYLTPDSSAISVQYCITADLLNNNTSPDPVPPETDEPVSPYGPDPEAEELGYTVRGSINWNDNADILGYRPKKVVLTLLRNGEVFTKAVLEMGGTETDRFKFTNLPKYDDSLEMYRYEVEQAFESWYVADGQVKDAYAGDRKKAVSYTAGNAYGTADFVNTFVIPTDSEGNPIPVIPGNSWHDVEISFPHNQKAVIGIALKMYETFYGEDGTESYGDLNGLEFYIPIGQDGCTVNNLPAGKYELSCKDMSYILKNVSVSGENVRVEDGFLYIDRVNKDITASVSLEFTKTGKKGYYMTDDRINYFAVSMSVN